MKFSSKALAGLWFAASLNGALALSMTTALGQSVSDINSADPLAGQSAAATARLQSLLGHAGASTGTINGNMGALTEAAIAAFEEMQDLEVDGKLDDKVWSALTKGDAKAFQTYTVTAEDAAFEPTPEIPETYAEMAKMEKLGYHSAAEMLAERFHMDQALLEALNEGADFTKEGTELTVAVPAGALDAVASIEVGKDNGRLRGMDADGKLVFSAPATVGSEENPSPEGSMKVSAIAPDPTYTYDPKNFGDDAKGKDSVVVPAGANGPVGTVWIDLAEPTYGIHGTPYPDKIASMESHGCVRLTNWDAMRLARAVNPGETTVKFVTQ